MSQQRLTSTVPDKRLYECEFITICHVAKKRPWPHEFTFAGFADREKFPSELECSFPACNSKSTTPNEHHPIAIPVSWSTTRCAGVTITASQSISKHWKFMSPATTPTGPRPKRRASAYAAGDADIATGIGIAAQDGSAPHCACKSIAVAVTPTGPTTSPPVLSTPAPRKPAPPQATTPASPQNFKHAR